MEINVEVSEVTLASIVHEATDYDRSMSVADLLVQAALARLTADREGWGSLQARVCQIRDEEIRAQIQPIIAQALAQPLCQTNSFGESIGLETTLRELVIKEAKAVLTQPADRGSHSRETFLAKTIREQVRIVLVKDVAEEVARAKEAVATEVGTLVADAVKQGMRSR